MVKYTMNIKAKGEAAYDLVGLGEMMVRFEPMPRGRTVADAEWFIRHIGGGELNPQVNYAILGGRTASVTSFPEHNGNAIFAYNQMRGKGVEMRYTVWVPYDQVGRKNRMGLNFTTPGDSARKNEVLYDRGHSAASRMKPGQVDWKEIFDKKGVRIFHTGGIFAALSESTPDVAEEAMEAATKYGTLVSYDINMRKHLWADIGGLDKAIEVNQRLVENYVNILFGNEKEFAALGIDVKLPTDVKKVDITDDTRFRTFAEALMKKYPNLHIIGRSMRNEYAPTLVDWGGMICVRTDNGLEFEQATPRWKLVLVERTGGGDTFYLGNMMKFLDGKSAKEAVEFGAAAAALKMCNAGDIFSSDTTIEKIVNEIEAAKGAARDTER